MKKAKSKIVSILSLFSILLSSGIVFALQVPGPKSTIFNPNTENAIDTNNIDNPIRDGTYMIIDNSETRNGESKRSVGGVVNIGTIEQHDEAKQTVLQIIKNIINYALGLLSFIALIYLIVHGIMMITAAGDDEKYKKGLKGIKYASIALIGIGVSFFLMSFVFWLVRIITVGPEG